MEGEKCDEICWVLLLMPPGVASGVELHIWHGTRLCTVRLFFSLVAKRNRYFIAEEHLHFHSVHGSA